MSRTSIVIQPERRGWLALLPLLCTAGYYGLPASGRTHLLLVFLPQLIAYVALALWLGGRSDGLERLGLAPARPWEALRIGVPTGLALGTVNVPVILFLVPTLGGDIRFLVNTPHARMPMWIMFPWTILVIAVLVELNFRGFLLGRLLALWQSSPLGRYDTLGSVLTVGVAAMVFAWDPFMVVTFRHLHWIALWDGLVWGWLWLRYRNLWMTIVAHAVEVLILYAVLKAALS